MRPIITLLTKVAGDLPFALGAILLIIAGILVYVVVVIRAAKKRQKMVTAAMTAVNKLKPAGSGKDEEDVEKKPSILDRIRGFFRRIFKKQNGQGIGLKQSFLDALALLKARVTGRDYRYKIPWFLLVGEAGSGKTTLLENTGLNLPFGRPRQVPGRKSGCNWWFFDRGIVLDIDGNYVLRADEPDADERSWFALLRLLQKYRPQRPIDGVVLTIPCTDLLGGPNQHEALAARARDKAAVLSDQLWQAQTRLGIRFPIYVLVTKCDEVPGFKSFFKELPESLRQDIFGWSSPYAVDTAYTSEWVDEAFGQTLDTLHQTQTEIFSEVREVEESDRVFLFPSEFQSIAAPLRIYLDHIFRQSVYQESFVCRGIYFSGEIDELPVEPAPAGSVPSPPDRPAGLRPRFLKHLFERKVFPEFGLSQPIARTLLSRNRTTLAAQVLLGLVLLFGSFGLWNVAGDLQAQQQTLLPVFRQIALDLRTVNERKNIPRRLFSKMAEEVLEGMSQIQRSDLSTVFIPSSWSSFSELHGEIVAAMTRAYDEIIMKSLADELQNKTDRIIYQEGWKPSAATSPIVAASSGPLNLAKRPHTIEDLPEFMELKEFMQNLDQLDQHLTFFNDLQSIGFGDPETFVEVVRYVFQRDLPPEFFDYTGFFEEALANVGGRHLVLDIYKEDASGRMREHFQRFYKSALENNIVLLYLDAISRQSEQLGQERRNTQGEDSLQHLLDTILQAEAALVDPKLAWLAKDTFEPGAVFTEVLTLIDQSTFLGPEFREKIAAEGEASFRRLKLRLLESETEHTGPLLERNDIGQVTLKFSPNILALKTRLLDLSGQEFAALKPTKDFTGDLPPGTRLMWNTDLLQAAVALAEPYEAFTGGGLQQFPSDWQKTVERASMNRLRANMVDLIAKAKEVEPIPEGFARLYVEDEIRLETRNFKQAVKPLGTILSAFDRLGFSNAYNNLFSLVVAQSSRLLRSVDALLEEERLYEAEDLSTWDGRRRLSMVMFGAQDPAEVDYYLDVQRERVRFMAFQYAEPMVTFLGNSRMSRGQIYLPLLTKWRGILRELRENETKKVGSSVTTLETFFRAEMDDIHLDTFLEKIPPEALTARSGDYFLQKRGKLLHAVYNRCLILAEREAVAGYEKMAVFFNQRLAGKFPFSQSVVDENTSEADLTAFREFYRLFDRSGRVGQAVIKRSPRLQQAGAEALTFLERIEAVRPFFASFLTGTEENRVPVPIVDFDVEFRVNRPFEIGGNQIIDWTMEVGEQTFRQSDANRRGRWRFGDPVSIALRWAKDGVYAPAPDGPHSRVDMAAGAILYEFDNHWSLISLLKSQASSAEDFEQFSDLNPHTLRFVIDLQSAGKSAERGAGKTKVFIRIRLLSPDKKDVLTLPVFPTQAPPLQES